MPVKMKEVGAKIRIVESRTGKVAKGQKGKALDSGGFKKTERGKARKMVTALNISMGYVPGVRPRKR